jgi:tRNA dimethylallyltransferase
LNDARPTIVVLVGPTASGKTAVSLPLAELIHAEIISADSRQIYRHLDIGTAKPTPREREQVPHHFIDIRNPDEEYSAGLFGDEGRDEADRILGRGRIPLVVGGSGLYIHSLVDGFFDGPPADPEFRAQALQQLRDGGIGSLLEELQRVDPQSASSIDPTKPRRVIRALEVHHITGIPLSVLQREGKRGISFVPLFFGLEVDRKELYNRINERCERLLKEGLMEEVEDLVARGYTSTQNALKTVGYAEVFAHRRGEIDREEMVRLFKQNTRHYAKRQLTWFRRDKRIHWIATGSNAEPARVAETIVKLIPPSVSSGSSPEGR